jgi:hypothetical protein
VNEGVLWPWRDLLSHMCGFCSWWLVHVFQCELAEQHGTAAMLTSIQRRMYTYERVVNIP